VIPVDGELFRVNRTNDISFICSARGIPPPSIRFLRGGVELNRTGGESGVGEGDLALRVQLADESFSVYMDDGTFMVSRMLTIFDAIEEDGGTFTCEASSTISELSLSLTNRSVFELAVQSKHYSFSLPFLIHVISMYLCKLDNLYHSLFGSFSMSVHIYSAHIYSEQSYHLYPSSISSSSHHHDPSH